MPFLIDTSQIADVDLDPHEILQQLRSFISRRRGDGMLLGEVNLLPEQLIDFFGGEDADEVNLLFNFNVMQAVWLALARQDGAPIAEQLEKTIAVSQDCQYVRAAHEQGIYVILDVVAHHTGNVFAYDPDRYATHDPATGRWYNDPRWDGRPYAVQGFNDRDGRPTLPFEPPEPGRMEAAWPDGAVWPREFQRPELYLRKGHITNWDYYPEYAEGDMFGLKTLDLRVQWDGQYPRLASALPALALVYGFWIAYADLDGFRIDAAKHMGEESLRTFCDVIREFAQSIGKENFLLVGEIGGSREHAWEVVERTGLDAALGIEDVPGKLERMVTGLRRPGGLLLAVPQLGPGGAGRAPLVPRPGGDPGGRPRPGPQGQRQVAASAATRGSATWRSTCWPCS